MADPNRVVLEQLLKKNWIPELKAKGFRGRPWKFVRERENSVDLVFLEFYSSGDGCRILLGAQPRHFPGAFQDEVPDFKRLRPEAYQFKEFVHGESGIGFGFDHLSEDEVLVLAEYVIDRFDEVSEPFFKEYDNLDLLRSFSPDDLLNNEDLLSRFGQAPRETAVFFCKMHRYLGEMERARSFAEAGLKSQKGIFGEQFMRGILFSELLENITTRARVAFVLTVAGDVVRRSLSDDPSKEIAEKAIGMAREWANGERLLGKDFDETIASVASTVRRKDDADQFSAWLCATSALHYAAFCAYRAAGDEPFPHPYDKTNEHESFCDVFDHAAKTWYFNAKRFQPLRKHLIHSYVTSNPLELGPPVNAEMLSEWHAKKKNQ